MSTRAQNEGPACSERVESLAETLDRHAVPGRLFVREGGDVRCLACAHRCRLREGRRGVCQVRFHRAGTLQVPFGYVSGLQFDPVEKKPFYHVRPGGLALTFGMLGCNLRCDYCQNWMTSQALRDSAAGAPIRALSPETPAALGRDRGAQLLVSSYNEPLISAEWAAAVFAPARAAGIACAMVTNGFATPEAIDFLAPFITAFKVDLKSFRERAYRSLGGRLPAVLETVREAVRRGIWVEAVTLLIPGFNDDASELREMARFLASVSPDLPWHVTAFHPDYRRRDARPTAAADLIRAVEIGAQAGLRFVYAGNLPGRVGRWESTFCPHCQRLLVERRGFWVVANRVGAEGRCPDCQGVVAGRWS